MQVFVRKVTCVEVVLGFIINPDEIMTSAATKIITEFLLFQTNVLDSWPVPQLVSTA